MFGKYSPAQLAKSIAVILTAAATFVTTTALTLTGTIPPVWTATLTAAAVFLTTAAAYLTRSAPTAEQIEANLEDTIDLVNKLRPGTFPPVQ